MAMDGRYAENAGAISGYGHWMAGMPKMQEQFPARTHTTIGPPLQPGNYMLRQLLFFTLVIVNSAYAADTFRFGDRLVEVGDSAAKLVEVAGAPAYKEPIESKEGGREGERWQYSKGGSTVLFVIKDGKIDSIEQKRD